MTQSWVRAGIVIALVVAAFATFGNEIADASSEAKKVQLHLDETNANMEALEKRVKELEDAHQLDEQRISELEGRRNSN